MSASESGLFNLQNFTDLGDPLIGGRLYTYAFGTTTFKTAYTDKAGVLPHTYTNDGIGGQFIALNARGELPAPLYLITGSYDIALKTAAGATVWTRRADPIDELANSLAAFGGSSLVGFLQSGAGANATNVQVKLRERVSVKDFGAKGDGITDDYASLRAAITAMETGELYFPPGNYLCSQTLFLTSQTGNNWNGKLNGESATITFTFTGNATDTDALMANGMVAYPKTLTFGSDISGTKFSTIRGIKFVGPANGCALRLANSQMVTVQHCDFNSSRYGIVTECCINAKIADNYFNDCINAGIGLLMTSNTTNVYYGSFVQPNVNDQPRSTYWNDSPEISGNLFQGSGAVFAGVLDHGSQAEGIRNLYNNIFYTLNSAPTMRYGYVARNCSPTFTENWSENVQNPFVMLSTDASRGGNTNVLSSGATVQPGGTYPLSRIVDGFCGAAIVEKNYFALPTTCLDVSGANSGTVKMGGNVAQALGSNGRISTVLVLATGSGYSTATTASIVGSGGTGAACYPVVVGGAITSIVFTQTGSGYSGPLVTIGGPGTDAVAVPTFSGGVITGFTIINQGSGYTTAPTITVTGGGGSGFTGTTTVAGGKLTGITITAGGSAFSFPTLTLANTGGGTGATFGQVQIGTHVYSSQAGSTWVTDSGDSLVVPFSAYYSRYKNLRFELYTKTNTGMGQLRNDVATAFASTCITSSSGTLTSAASIQYSFYQMGMFVFFDCYITVTTVGAGSGNIVLSLPPGYPMTSSIQYAGNGTYGASSLGLVAVPASGNPLDKLAFQLSSGVGNAFASGAGNGHVSGWFITSAPT